MKIAFKMNMHQSERSRIRLSVDSRTQDSNSRFNDNENVAYRKMIKQHSKTQNSKIKTKEKGKAIQK
jgi:hypothetical protein